MPGAAEGRLGSARFVPLGGVVTALAEGDLDRRNPGTEIVAAILTENRSEVVVLGNRGGGLRPESSVLATAEPVVALATGRFDRDKSIDLAVGAGDALTLLPGDPLVPSSRRTMPSGIRSLSFGRFAEDDRSGRGVAVLLDDGKILLLRSATAEDSRLTIVEDRVPAGSGAQSLAALNLSNRPGHDLILNDVAGQQLLIRIGGLADPTWTTFESNAPIVAVLPMQLNDDMFADLVVQTEGSAAPGVSMSSPAAIYTVDSTTDDPDANLGDGVCATTSGLCSLRAAIEQANAAAGSDAIGFDIAGTAPYTIIPQSPLPAITDPLTLDGTTEPDYVDSPVVELDGTGAGDSEGLVVLTGSTTIKGLAVHGFTYSGIAVGGGPATEVRIQANYIGTDVTGTVPRGNLASGVHVFNGAALNVIGTDGDGVADDREGNLVSANAGDGIAIVDLDTDQNFVAGNLVGTDVEGTADLGNGSFGVAVLNSAEFNVVGTNGDGVSDVHERNIVSGNGIRGVLLAGEAANNVVAGNYIGTDLDGTGNLANASDGVEISNGARDNLVGTDADGQSDDLERNVISGNGDGGITTFGEPPVTGNTIAGNYIGTDASGTVALANGGNGIIMGETTDMMIGGGLPAARNVISANGGDGIYVGDTSTTIHIAGNYIGTDASGTAALGNANNGILIAGSALNVVGTDGDGVGDDAEGNVISANTADGVVILFAGADSNVIAGNLIGTDATGTQALGNAQQGVAIVDSPQANRVGTDGDGISDDFEGNVVSGNGAVGVLMAFGAADNVVAGNLIGTDVTGVLAVPNEGFGVELSNGALSNLIGTDVDGQSDALERNVISGNVSSGISLFGSPSTDYNVIAGNFVGTQADGSSPLGNQSHGIILNADASFNTIGGLGVTPGVCDGPCNVIAYNGTGRSLDGVRIIEGIHNAVVGNVIHSNHAGAGIDLADAPTSPNDPGDPDTGANNVQNFPVLSEAVSSAGTTTIVGTLNSLANTDFRIELFSNAACDPSGFGEGEHLIAVHTVATAGDGWASFSVPVTPEVPAGHWVTATATRMEPGPVPTDTSEFSPCVGVGAVTAAGTVPDGVHVPGIQLTASRGSVGTEVLLSWGDSCIAADVDYAVYLGTLGDFTSHWARRCSTEGQTSTAIRNNEPAIYFLVVPLSVNRDGSLGVDSDGIERAPGYSVCHEQLVGECD
jgi:titin